MFGWRGRLGWVVPRAWDASSECDQILRQVKGVSVCLTTLNLERESPEEFEKIFPLYEKAAEYISHFGVSSITLQGSVVIAYNGWEKSMELARRIEKSTGVPTRLQLENHFDALRALGAKNVVLTSYSEKARNDERKKLMEELGFKVLSMRGASAPHALDIGRTIPYASYKLAKEAYLEAPEADAIYISGPTWEVVEHIEALEKDTGKPVVASTTADLWAGLNIAHVREPIEGYGRLLREIPPLPDK